MPIASMRMLRGAVGSVVGASVVVSGVVTEADVVVSGAGVVVPGEGVVVSGGVVPGILLDVVLSPPGSVELHDASSMARHNTATVRDD